MKKFIFRHFIVGLGISLSVLAFMKLFSSIFNLDYVQSILFIIEAYTLLVNVIIGWMEPVANAIIKAIIKFFDVSLKLGNDWKDIFVLLSIYFLRECAVAFSDHKKITAIYLFIVGTLISLIVSVSISSLNLEKAKSLQFLIILTPITGILIYELMASIWKASPFFNGPVNLNFWDNLKRRLFFVCRRWVVAITSTLTLYFILSLIITSLSSYIIAWFVVILYVIGLGLEWIRVGVVESSRLGNKGIFWKRATSVNTGKVGLGMIGVVLIASLVAAISVKVGN